MKARHPTTEEIKAFPASLQRYIHDLETRCDPAGDVQQLGLLKDQNEQLQVQVVEQRAERDRLVAVILDEVGARRGSYIVRERFHDPQEVQKRMTRYRDLCVELDK